MVIPVYIINAFAKLPGGGNPAGIVLDADALSDGEMQRIAKAVGFSETAFVLKSNIADLRVRFFTPVNEVNLCGHATIGLFTLLAQKGALKPENYTQETKAGILPVELRPDGTVLMTQNLPDFANIVAKAEIAESLEIPGDPDGVLTKDLPVQIVSTGLRDILVPVNSLVQLERIQPDFDKISAVSRRYGVIGYHLFSLETAHGGIAHCRNFAPLFDIPEEAATGTSSGALCCYLHRYGLCHDTQMVFEQGYSMNRPSEIMAELAIEHDDIASVKVGGTARDVDIIEVKL